MTSISATSLAAAVGATVRNVVFELVPIVLQRKIVIIGTYDNTNKTDIVPNTLYRVYSAADVANRFGRGFMLHRLAMKAYLGSNGVETWVIPQTSVGAKSTGKIAWTAAVSQRAGTIHLYISGDYIPVYIPNDSTSNNIAQLVSEEINRYLDLPITGSYSSNETIFTAKDKGAWNGWPNIPIAFNLGIGQEFPNGMSYFLTPMGLSTLPANGRPDIQLALDALGKFDEQNELFFTDLIHGYWFPDVGGG